MPYKLISLVFLFFFLIISNSISVEEFILPVKKPSIFKNYNEDMNSIKSTNLPQKKPVIKSTEETKTKDKNDPTSKPKPKIKIEENEIKKVKKIFIFPKKKPVTYKITKKGTENSTVLNSKDFARAKETLDFVKAKKWNSALKSADKVKDREFKTLIMWMYLKTTGNSATFNDYKKFIEQNSDYPRINRIKYLAEQKIYLRNNSPTSIINWFKKHPPLGGLGKIKLAEALLEQGKTTEVNSLIKDAWVTAEIRKNDLGYYRAKFKKFLTSEDHLKRADFLAWERKYWDLKRMLKYLPKDERALYNARQILMSNSYGVDNAISKVPAHL